MDIGASVVASKHARCRIATVAIHHLQFIRPVHVGDSMSCYGKLVKIGNTSMTIMLEAWCRRFKDPDCEELVAEGEFVFVALDKAGKPCSVRQI